jgi:hypothetical protein
MKQTRQKKHAPKPEKLPGAVKYRAPKGKAGDRPLERIRQGHTPNKPE